MFNVLLAWEKEKHFTSFINYETFLPLSPPPLILLPHTTSATQILPRILLHFLPLNNSAVWGGLMGIFCLSLPLEMSRLAPLLLFAGFSRALSSLIADKFLPLAWNPESFCEPKQSTF
jgi:hypothetical protein